MWDDVEHVGRHGSGAHGAHRGVPLVVPPPLPLPAAKPLTPAQMCSNFELDLHALMHRHPATYSRLRKAALGHYRAPSAAPGGHRRSDGPTAGHHPVTSSSGGDGRGDDVVSSGEVVKMLAEVGLPRVPATVVTLILLRLGGVPTHKRVVIPMPPLSPAARASTVGAASAGGDGGNDGDNLENAAPVRRMVSKFTLLSQGKSVVARSSSAARQRPPLTHVASPASGRGHDDAQPGQQQQHHGVGDGGADGGDDGGDGSVAHGDRYVTIPAAVVSRVVLCDYFTRIKRAAESDLADGGLAGKQSAPPPQPPKVWPGRADWY